MNFFKTIFSDEYADLGQISSSNTELYVSMFFALISAVLTGLNIIKNFNVMAIATSILIVGFILAGLMAHLKKKLASRIIMAVLCGIIFSFFAVSGGNDGFAILWILLVPIVSSLLIGLRMGFILNVYFQLFLVVLFYTPLSNHVSAYYTETFIMRFPILYFATFCAVTYMVYQRYALYQELNKRSYIDALTGIRNRMYFSEYSRNFEKDGLDSGLVVFSLDLNELKHVNDTLGHAAGDELIREAARLITEAFTGDVCCRTGGDEYMVISTRKDCVDSIEVLKEKTKAWKGNGIDKMTISVGYARCADYPDLSFEELSKVADKDMYANKSRYYREAGIDRRNR